MRRSVGRLTMAAMMVILASMQGYVSIGPSSGAASTSIPTTAKVDIDGTFDVGGRSLYLRCVGTGSPTVVFESGSDVTSEAWQPIQAALAPTTRACAYDRANLGRSDPAALPRTGADVVDDLHRLLDQAEVTGPYVLVGASLGGLFVRLYAQAYPEDVAGIVLLDALHEDLVPMFTRLVGPDMVEPILAALANRDDVEGFVVDGLPRPDLTAEVRTARLTTPFPAVPLDVITPGTFQVFGVASLPGWPEAAANLLWSRLQADLATLTPDGRLVLAEGSGHFVQGDRPDLVIDSITEIVAGARGATPVATPSTASRRTYPTA